MNRKSSISGLLIGQKVDKRKCLKNTYSNNIELSKKLDKIRINKRKKNNFNILFKKSNAKIKEKNISINLNAQPPKYFYSKLLLLLLLRLLKEAFYPFRIIFSKIIQYSLSWADLNAERGIPERSSRASRMYVLAVSLCFFAVFISYRLYSLQGMEKSKWDGIASKQHKTMYEVSGARGVITDRNGVELAVSIPAITIGAHPTWIKNKDKAAESLSQIILKPKDEILNKLNSTLTYTILANGVSQAKENEIRALKLYGIELEKDYLRIYPQGDLASNIIGRTGRNGLGLSGVERSHDDILTAGSIKRTARRDARGRLIHSGLWDDRNNIDTSIAPTRLANVKSFNDEINSLFNSNEFFERSAIRNEGGDITITIDSTIQSILEEEIDFSRENSKAKHVFGAVMDAHTGEILALGQSNRFNPNETKGLSSESLRNILLQNTFEPGSTFKPIVAAIALDKGYVGYNELINCENGSYRIGKHTIRDVHPVSTVSFEQVIVRSSNIGMFKMANRMGKSVLYDSLKEFGFGAKTEVGLSGESKGIFRNVSKWAQIDVATHSFGQGISVTALQMMQAYGALANGGMLMRPKIFISENEESGVRVLKESTAAQIRTALNLVTEDAHGTGKNSRIPGVPVFGKTGTAQKAKAFGRGYDSSKVLASFIGFVDGHSIGVPRTLVAYIAVDEPGVTPRWGGTLAAPVFRKVLERSLSYLLSNDSKNKPQIAVGKSQGNLKPLS